MKKKFLLKYHQEIESWKAKDSVLMEFHKGRIHDFYKANRVYLDALLKDIDRIRKFFWVHVDGKLQKDGTLPIFKKNRTEDEFNVEWARLMNQESGAAFKINTLYVSQDEEAESEEKDLNELEAQAPIDTAKKIFRVRNWFDKKEVSPEAKKD